MKTSVIVLAALALLGCAGKTDNDGNKNNHVVKETEVARSAPKHGYAQVNGIKMYYEVHGQGEPLVLLHGGGSTIETTFGRIITGLSIKRQVIAVELQGHGHTADRDTELSFEQDADDVAELMRQLGIAKADFFGFSNGGNTVIQIAIRYPHLVNKVIAASPLLKRSGAFPQFWDFMREAKFEHMPVEYKDAFLKITGDTARLKSLHNKCAQRVVNLKDVTDEQLNSIKAPVLLVSGDADVATPEHMVQMWRLIPTCKLAIIPGGHGEYLGEITTLKPTQTGFEIMLIVNKFLERPNEKVF